jgi:hypothetical protein
MMDPQPIPICNKYIKIVVMSWYHRKYVKVIAIKLRCIVLKFLKENFGMKQLV